MPTGICAGDQVGGHRRAAAVGHVRHLDLHRRLDHLADDVADRARPAAAEAEARPRRRPSAGPSASAGPVFGLAITSTGATPSIATWVNCFTGSYGCFGERERADRQRRRVRQHQRVAVGRRAHHLERRRSCRRRRACCRRSPSGRAPCASGSEITRATMSLAPPAAKVTTMRIGLSGQAAHGRRERRPAVRSRPGGDTNMGTLGGSRCACRAYATPVPTSWQTTAPGRRARAPAIQLPR